MNDKYEPAPYDGRKFYNHQNNNEVKKHKGKFLKFLKWRLSRKVEAWPEWIENKKFALPDKRSEKLKATFINHSTVLIQVDGLNILTDPVWSKRVSPFSWLGPKRVRKAGIDINDLPHIDLILVSHDHYDHLDIASLKILHEKFKPQIISGLKVNKVLHKHGLNCIELNWWEETNFKNLKITYLPAKHWSGRYGFFGNNATLWGGFAIESNDKKIYFAGDTAYTEHLKLIHEKFEYFDLSLLPIGAYKPNWFMKGHHTSPHEAVLLHKELNSKKSIAVHYGTFRLSDESYEDPIQDLKLAIDKLNPKYDFIALDHGEAIEV